MTISPGDTAENERAGRVDSTGARRPEDVFDCVLRRLDRLLNEGARVPGRIGDRF